jgi:O-antigen ligase
VCAAILLLDSREARCRWVWAQLFVGLGVVVAALKFDGVGPINAGGQLTLATVDTITTSRFVGVAFVVLVLLSLMSLRQLWWALPLAGVCAMVLVHVGSRGPSLSALLSVAGVVVVGRVFVRRRLVLVPVTLAVAVATYVYAERDGGSGGARIVASLQSGLSDDVRATLRRDAFRLGLQHPFSGIGWGDFADHSKTAHKIANAQGVAYAHNSFAEAFGEGGLLALAAFAVVVVLTVYRLQRLSSDPYEAVVLGTAVYWLLNAQVSSDFVGNRFMWISIAVGIASYVDSARLRRTDSGHHSTGSTDDVPDRAPSGDAPDMVQKPI